MRDRLSFVRNRKAGAAFVIPYIRTAYGAWETSCRVHGPAFLVCLCFGAEAGHRLLRYVVCHTFFDAGAGHVQPPRGVRSVRDVVSSRPPSVPALVALLHTGSSAVRLRSKAVLRSLVRHVPEARDAIVPVGPDIIPAAE